MNKNIVLDKWQEEVLDYEGDLLLCTGRRVGKTYILARKAIDLMASKKDCPIVMISLTEDQAMIIMSMALNYAREKYPFMIGKGRNKPTLRSLVINNNKMIIRPVGLTGDGARGFEGGILIVDEAARMPSKFWIAALPTILTTNGKIWMSSTPFGKQGYFWDRFNESYNEKIENARFKVFYVTTEQVMKERPISEAWTQEQREGAIRILAEDERTMTKLEYGQEYLGLFLEDLQQFFKDILITSCMKRYREPPISNHNYYLGVDIARQGIDESTFIIVEKRDERVFMVEMQVTKRTYLNETTKHILELNRIWDFQKIFIDDEGIGVGVFDYLIENEETRRKTISINNSQRMTDYKDDKRQKIFKEILYNNLLGMMERGEIEFLKDDSIFSSLKSIQYEYSKDNFGNLHFKITGSYSHIAEGITRAAWCIKYKDSNFWIRSIKA
jgi:hypothetical protein